MHQYRYVKRLLDVIFAFILLILLSPLLLIILLLIVFSSKSYPIFVQERLGLNSKPFFIYKFRTMRCEAPNLAAKDIDNEMYVTSIGKILRKMSLDELPQLLNIIKGDMSFVGPRPLIPNEGEINLIRHSLKIDTLRPGLTGWAQVRARDTCDDQEKIKLDLYYKENFGILIDAKVILSTFGALRGK